jgi:hypothetical protein
MSWGEIVQNDMGRVVFSAGDIVAWSVFTPAQRSTHPLHAENRCSPFVGQKWHTSASTDMSRSLGGSSSEDR